MDIKSKHLSQGCNSGYIAIFLWPKNHKQEYSDTMVLYIMLEKFYNMYVSKINYNKPMLSSHVYPLSSTVCLIMIYAT